jgi:hypothetical protein
MSSNVLHVDLSDPAIKIRAITPSDTVAISTGITRGVYCSVGGTATLLFANDTDAVEVAGLLAGVVYPFCIQRVNATGRTATLLALY